MSLRINWKRLFYVVGMVLLVIVLIPLVLVLMLILILTLLTFLPKMIL